MSLDITKILTLGVFDYKTVSNMLTMLDSGSIQEENIKTTNLSSLLTKTVVRDNQQRVGGKINERTARAWLKYWNCVDRCRLPSNIDKECPGCNSKLITNTPPSPPSFPCCSQCVSEKCIAATGNPNCSLGGGQPNGELLLIAQTLCYRDAYQTFLTALDCYECVINARVECGNKCSRPAGPEPDPNDVFEVLPEKEWNPDFMDLR